VESHQFLEAGERLEGGARRLGDGVTNLRIGHALDATGDEADLAGTECLHDDGLGREHAQLLHLVILGRVHQPDLGPRADRTLEDADDDHHAAVRVVPRVEDQRLQRRVGVAFGRRQPMNDRLEDVLDPATFLGAGEDGGGAVEPDDLLDLAAGLVWLGARQVDLVDDRDDLEAVVHGEIGVGERLRLDALRRIHQQQGALAGGQRPGDLVPKVHVARRVDQVQHVGQPVVGLVAEPNRMGLDRDAPLALQIHRVEHLGFHLACLERASDLEEAIRQSRLAVVDVRDDREVADVALYQGRPGKESPHYGSWPPSTGWAGAG
jgi:hypothetical protein